LLLGFLQAAQGEGSPLRFYAFTNASEAVGFFANRNHFAALLNVSLILAGVWFSIAAGRAFDGGLFKTRSSLWFTAAAAFLVADVAGLALARSRAGLILAVAALMGTVLMGLRQRQRGSAKEGPGSLSVRRASAAIVLFAVIFAAQFGLGSILSRFEGDRVEDLRVALNRTGFKAALDALPFGTGLGSFVPVYAAAEHKEDLFAGFANRAHNDLIEIVLETGMTGIVLLSLFLAWFAKKAYAAWSSGRGGEGAADALLERAATLIIALLLAHSLMDYPLRTAALGSIFALFCAILAVPAGLHSKREGDAQRRDHSPGSGTGPRAPVVAAELWGGTAEWPDEWRGT
jgi:O-antigen ligase